MRICSNAALLLSMAVVLGPVIALVGVTADQLLAADLQPNLAALGITARQLWLLARSVLFALGVAAAATVLGTVAASWLWQRQQGAMSWLRWFFLLLVLVPPYVHAQAWQGALAGLISLDGALTASVPISGWLPALWVELMVYLPLTTGMALLGLCAVDPQQIEAARIHGGDFATLRQVMLPLAAPQITAAGSLVFLFSLTDYGNPSLFQVSSYALEIFTHYSSGGPTGGALLVSIPLLLIAVPVLTLAVGGLRAVVTRPLLGQRRLETRLAWPWWLKSVQVVAVLLLLIQIAVPLFNLGRLAGGWSTTIHSIDTARAEIGSTAGVAIVAGVLGVLLALILATRLGEAGAKQTWLWFAVLLPLAVPAPLLGIGLVAIWNHPSTQAAYSSQLMPVLLSLSRFTPVAALVVLAQLKRVDSDLIDTARLYAASRWQEWLAVRLPLYAPGLLAAGLLVAVLSAGEFGGTLIVAPPGRATLSMRIYNYLHYGASESVAGLCLALTALSLLAAVVILLGVRQRRPLPFRQRADQL